MANIYTYYETEWVYHNVTRVDDTSFQFAGVGAYAETSIMGKNLGVLGSELFLRGVITPSQGRLTQGLCCRLDMYSKQDSEQEDWEVEKHFIYIKGDKNGAINQKVTTIGGFHGFFDHVDIKLVVLPDSQLSGTDTIDLSFFAIDDPTLNGELPAIKDSISYHEMELNKYGLQLVEILGDEETEGRLPIAEENLSNVHNELLDQNETLATIIADNSISQPERIELSTTLTNVRRESLELYEKLSGEGAVAEALSDAADDLIDALSELLDLADYGNYDFDTLTSLYATYSDAMNDAREAVAGITETKLTNITAGQIALGDRIGIYEEQLILEPDEITMKVSGNTAMKLTANDLQFISEEYRTQISLHRWQIFYNDMAVMSISEDEMRIPKIISTGYIGIGRIKFVPAYEDGVMVGTDIVFVDDPTEI